MSAARVIATVATKATGYYPIFVATCKNPGNYDAVTWGLGEEWKDFRTFIRLCYSNLTQMDPDTIVLICDSYDLVFTAPADPVFDYFERMSAGKDTIMIAKEQGLPILGSIPFLLKSQFGTYDGVPINTGTVLGRAGLLGEMFRTIWEQIQLNPNATVDDQRLITSYLCDHRDITVIIDDNRFFLNLPAGRTDLCKNVLVRPPADGERYSRILYKHKDGLVYRPVCVHRSVNGEMSFLLSQMGLTKEEMATGNTRSWYTPIGLMHHANVFLQDKAHRVAHGTMRAFGFEA